MFCEDLEIWLTYSAQRIACRPVETLSPANPVMVMVMITQSFIYLRADFTAKGQTQSKYDKRENKVSTNNKNKKQQLMS
jgi:hypothetical protein